MLSKKIRGQFPDLTEGKKEEVNITYPDGRKYVGEFMDGQPHGHGKMTHPRGMYVGEHKDGKPNGQGTETFPDGIKYVGEFKNGKEHGQGTISWSDGRKYVGEMKDTKRWNGIHYDKNGNITGKYLNGKMIKQ